MTGADFAGDRGFIDRGDALHHLAIAGDEIARLDKHQVALLQIGRSDHLVGALRIAVAGAVRQQSLGVRFGARLAQCGGLRLAAALRHRFSKIREYDGEPEPEDDLEGEAEMPAAGRQIAQEEHGGEDRDDLTVSPAIWTR